MIQLFKKACRLRCTELATGTPLSRSPCRPPSCSMWALPRGPRASFLIFKQNHAAQHTLIHASLNPAYCLDFLKYYSVVFKFSKHILAYFPPPQRLSPFGLAKAQTPWTRPCAGVTHGRLCGGFPDAPAVQGIPTSAPIFGSSHPQHQIRRPSRKAGFHRWAPTPGVSLPAAMETPAAQARRPSLPARFPTHCGKCPADATPGPCTLTRALLNLERHAHPSTNRHEGEHVRFLAVYLVRQAPPRAGCAPGGGHGPEAAEANKPSETLGDTGPQAPTTRFKNMQNARVWIACALLCFFTLPFMPWKEQLRSHH